MNKIKKTIIDFVRKAKLNLAFKLFDDEGINDNEIVLLNFRWSNINATHSKGVISDEIHQIELSKISKSILEFINNMEGESNLTMETLIDEDEKILKKFKELLPLNGTIKIMRNFLIFENFDLNWFSDFVKAIQYTKGTPEFEFIDTDLEKLRSNFFDSIDEFYRQLVVHSKRISSTERAINWADDDKYTDIVIRLERKRKEVVMMYDQLLKTARRKKHSR